MLNELLVLGQVPGTNFQVTFSDYMAIICVLALVLVWRRNPRLFRYAIAKTELLIAIFLLRFKQPAMPIARTS